jgi:N-acetylmuramoyl-L-alanine amidase
MIALVLAMHLPLTQIVIATPRGETRVPVTTERGMVAVAAPLLTGPLGLTLVLGDTDATLRLDGAVFTVRLGAPFVRLPTGVCPLVGDPYVARDTLFLPLSFLAICLPRAFGSRFRWDPTTARLVEAADSVAPVTMAHHPRLPMGPPNSITKLRMHHLIAIDAGHGGVDPGNPGVYLPRGVSEKDITLGVARLLRAELLRRDIGVIMIRSGDTLIDIHDRPSYCVDACELFVSIHVNSMNAGPHRSRAHGIETYFLSDAKTEDAARVAKMENDAVRYERGGGAADTGKVGFILRDLTQNEYLRESARIAELVQDRVGAIAPGGSRGVQQAPFWVLKDARRPAILVETGFATNRADGEFLSDARGQHKIAAAIADGVVAYLQELERRLAPERSGR